MHAVKVFFIHTEALVATTLYNKMRIARTTVNKLALALLCTRCLYGTVRNDFEAGNIHYKGHWKGGGAENREFLGP